MKKIKPTASELEILQILWKKGPCTVKDINDELNQKREIGYTTSLKIMQLMFEKGILSRESQGRSHIYKALLKEDQTREALIDNLMDAAFGGSAMQLVMQTLGNKKTSKEELKKIKDFIDKLETKK